MKVEIQGLKTKTIVIAQRYAKNDVISFVIIVKAKTNVIEFNVSSIAKGVDKTFDDVASALKFYGEL